MLGMGDVVILVEKAQEQVSVEEAQALQEKMAAGKMTMDDFLNQLRSLRKMGSMKSLMGMLPGIGKQLEGLDFEEKQIDRTEAIIKSMTKRERTDIEVLDNSRRRRIAKGSGTNQNDVSQLVKGFTMVSSLSKQMSGMGMLGRLRALSGLSKMNPAMLGHARLQGGGASGGGGQKYKQRKKKSR
jgi:signal recognition particle subunit SRP54